MNSPPRSEPGVPAGARRAVRSARRGLALTGAGVSAASGVPTFRGEDGLWRDHRPEELATPGAFADDPRQVWEWYAWRRRRVDGCRPNAAHRALARWTIGREGVRVVTQNVDDLHGEALREVSADRPPPDHARTVELHGSLFRTRCTGCDRRRAHRDPVDASSRRSLPRCGDCGALLRPDVVWFGESLPRRDLDAATRAARGAEVCLVAGTSASVEPAASLARLASEVGAVLIEVNPERTPLTEHADHVLRAGAEAAVPALLEDSSPPRGPGADPGEPCDGGDG